MHSVEVSGILHLHSTAITIITISISMVVNPILIIVTVKVIIRVNELMTSTMRCGAEIFDLQDLYLLLVLK